MELFRRVEAEVIHIFVTALTVDKVVELNMCGFFAEEFDIYLVPGIAVYEVSFIVINRVFCFVIARADKECRRRADLFGGLHSDFVVAVAVVGVSAHFAAFVLIYGFARLNALFIIDGNLYGLFGLTYGELTYAVFVRNVVARPISIERRAVAPAVRLKDCCGFALRKICEHLTFEGLIRQVFRLPVRRCAGGNRHSERHCRRCRHCRQNAKKFVSHSSFSL